MNDSRNESDGLISDGDSDRHVAYKTDYTPQSSQNGYDQDELDARGLICRVYKRRWYILFIYCSVGLSNYISWNTWDPIQRTAKYVYGWNNGIISLLADWGLITLIAFPPFYAALLKKKGLRKSELVTVTWMFIGALIRVVPWKYGRLNTIMINISQFCTGTGGIIPMAGASLLSITWFPPSERRFATSLASGSQQIGLAMSFLLGPLLVEEPILSDSYNASSTVSSNDVGIKSIEYYWNEIQFYLRIQFAIVTLLSACIVAYFPARPPLPPSNLSISGRHFFGYSIRLIVRQSRFWILAFVYGFFSGLFNSYLAVIAIDLEANPKLQFTQFWSGWLGFATTIIGASCSVAVAALADLLRAYNPIKKLLLALLIVGFLSYGWFILIAKSIVEVDLSPEAIRTIVYVLIILTGCASSSTVPLIFEIGADILYPIPEEVIGSMLVLVQNTCGLTFLLVMLVPGVGTNWVDYAVMGGLIASFPVVFMLDDRNRRLSAEF
ncbi:solute carrier family 49 member 4 homolog [Convolutriloba macropyga]|uniref:solute carrier family 49 member 4 homolog n=1 Tax=Convolutriloba macropyga TaxID=536237 RepID=UPI003F51D7C8